MKHRGIEIGLCAALWLSPVSDALATIQRCPPGQPCQCSSRCHLPNPSSAVCPKQLHECFQEAFLAGHDDSDEFSNGEEISMGTDPQLDGDVNECLRSLDGENLAKCEQACQDEPGRGSYTCSCFAGYDVSAADDQQCVDHPDCDNEPCAAHSQCLETPGSYLCPCDSGFFGDGKSAGGCVDVDHCAVSPAPCSPLSVCVSTAASFECRACRDCKGQPCPAGYTGQGKGPDGCQDVRECSNGTALCDPLTDCIEQEGGYACGPCPEGYAGNGVDGCRELTVCAGASCSPHAVCVSEGNVGCQCIPGFEGDGIDCQDIDECQGADPCPSDSVCINLPGAYHCACVAGSRWDGEHCVAVASPTGAAGEGSSAAGAPPEATGGAASETPNDEPAAGMAATPTGGAAAPRTAPDGGCQVNGGASTGGWWWLGLGVTLTVWRRRRRA